MDPTEDRSKTAFGSNDFAVEENVRSKAIQVQGVEDALLLKIMGSRVSPLREGWGDWFDKKKVTFWGRIRCWGLIWKVWILCVIPFFKILMLLVSLGSPKLIELLGILYYVTLRLRSFPIFLLGRSFNTTTTCSNNSLVFFFPTTESHGINLILEV